MDERSGAAGATGPAGAAGVPHAAGAAGAVPGGRPLAADPPRSDRATWALWLGLAGVGFGFLLMFAVLTPAAIVYGVKGLREIRARPELTGRVRAWTGIGLAIVAPLLWVGVFVALLVDGVA